METEFLIRNVQPDDAEAIVGILNPIIATGIYTVFDTPLSVEAEQTYIQNFPQRGIFLVAIRRHDKKLVGFQSMEPFATYTRAFAHVGVVGTYVDLACRRQGIATRLFEATFAAAKQQGYEKIFTYVRADNAAGIGTYLKQDFRIVGTAQRQAKINQAYVDEIIIERFL